MANRSTWLSARIPTGALDSWRTLRTAHADSTATPCQADPGPWFADTPEARGLAAHACGSCPIVAPCRDYADAAGERCGVWGGQDRHVPSRRRAPADGSTS